MATETRRYRTAVLREGRRMREKIIEANDFIVMCHSGAGYVTISEFGADDVVILARESAIAAAKAILEWAGETE